MGSHMAREAPLLQGPLGQTLVFLSKTPFASATDLAVLMLMPTRVVSGHLQRLRRLRLVDCRTRAMQSLRWSRLYWVTTRGLRTAVRQGLMIEEEAWRSAAITQSLSGRVDTAVIITRVATELASAIDADGEIIHSPFRHPADALIRVGDGWGAVFRQGYAQRRTLLQERLARYEGEPDFALILTPTVTDRSSIDRYMQRDGQIDACVVVDGLVGAMPAGSKPWIYVPDSDFVDEEEVASLLPACDRPDPPRVRGRRSPLRSIANGFRYGTGVTRLLNALVDWHMVRMDDLMDILQVQPDTLYKMRLEAGDLVESKRGFLRRDGDAVRLCLSTDGIRHVARRDLVKANAMLADLSVDRDERFTIPYAGSRIRQWTRQSFHDDYVAATAGDIVWSMEADWTRHDIIPSSRSEMTVRAGNPQRARAVERHVEQWRRHTCKRRPRTIGAETVIRFRPDAVIMLMDQFGETMQILLEVERSARTPAELERRLEIYLIHSLLGMDDDGVPLFSGLWVFEDPSTESEVWRLIRGWREQSLRLPFIATSTTSQIQEHGALGRVWRTQGRYIYQQTLDEAIGSLDPPLDGFGR